jgi:glycosyltransferase
MDNQPVRYWESKPFKNGLLEKGWAPPHPTLFLHKRVYQKHRLFDTRFKIAGDYDFILRIFSDTDLTFCYLPEVITNMRIGGASTGGIKNLINKKKEDYWVLKKNKMPYPLWILLVKNVSKISQLFFR